MAYRHHLPPRYHVVWCAGDGVDQAWTSNKQAALDKVRAAKEADGFVVAIGYDVFTKKKIAVVYPGDDVPRARKRYAPGYHRRSSAVDEHNKHVAEHSTGRLF